MEKLKKSVCIQEWGKDILADVLGALLYGAGVYVFAVKANFARRYPEVRMRRNWGLVAEMSASAVIGAYTWWMEHPDSGDVEEAKRQIEQTGCEVLGAVLNDVDVSSISSRKYYNKRYYSHYESGYYLPSEKKQPAKKKPAAPAREPQKDTQKDPLAKK